MLEPKKPGIAKLEKIKQESPPPTRFSLRKLFFFGALLSLLIFLLELAKEPVVWVRTQKDIPKVMKSLQHPTSNKVRKKAIYALHRASHRYPKETKQAIPLLMKMAKKDFTDVRIKAMEALIAIDPTNENWFSFFAEMAKNTQEWHVIRKRALEILAKETGKYYPEKVKAFLYTCVEGDEVLNSNAFDYLESYFGMSPKEILEILEKYLKTGNSTQWQFAIKYLTIGRPPGKKAIPLLIQQLKERRCVVCGPGVKCETHWSKWVAKDIVKSLKGLTHSWAFIKKHSEKLLNIYVEMLNSGDPYAWKIITKELIEIGINVRKVGPGYLKAQLIKIYTKMLKAEKLQFWQFAIEELRKMGASSKEAVPTLKQQLKQKKCLSCGAVETCKTHWLGQELILIETLKEITGNQQVSKD